MLIARPHSPSLRFAASHILNGPSWSESITRFQTILLFAVLDFLRFSGFRPRFVVLHSCRSPAVACVQSTNPTRRCTCHTFSRIRYATVTFLRTFTNISIDLLSREQGRSQECCDLFRCRIFFSDLSPALNNYTIRMYKIYHIREIINILNN